MPSKPSSLTNTMTGLAALMTLSAGNEIFDKIISKINSGSGGILKTVADWLVNRLRDAFNAVVTFLNPTAPGAFGWLMADPSWLDTLFTSTYTTLGAHRSRLLWLQNTYIKGIHVLLTRDINRAHDDALSWTNKVGNALNQSMVNIYNNLRAQINSLHVTLTNDINRSHDDSLRWTNISISNVTNTINQLYNWTNGQITATRNAAIAYTNKQISAVESKLTALGLTLAASIAALGAFLTTVVIPDAIEASVIALNAEAAVAMDLKWELVATTGNKALAELGLADLNPLWLTDVLSEIPAVSIADADLDITSALKLLMDYLNRAGVPLYKNLKQFGEDTAELDGLITTVLLGGLTTAAVLDPRGTADVLTDVLGGPLVDVLTELADVVGLA